MAEYGENVVENVVENGVFLIDFGKWAVKMIDF